MDSPLQLIEFKCRWIGGKLLATINYDIIKNKHIYGIAFHIGYKSSGFSIGEQLYEGTIIRGEYLFN